MKKILSLLLMLFMGMTVWASTEVTDILTASMTGVSGTNYTSWTDVTSNSDAVYAGQSAAGNDAIQLRSKNSNSGIITTASGGTIKKIIVTWNSNTDNGRTLDIYGKDVAYTSPTQLYQTTGNTGQGTKIGSIVNGTSTTLEITDNYTFIGMRSASGAMYIDKIEIIWEINGETPPPTTCYSVTLPNSLIGGTVTANISNLTQIAEGTTVTITATPETGYELDWMKVNDEEVTNPYSFTINENKIVTAAFKEKSIAEVSTAAEFIALENGKEFKFTGNLVCVQDYSVSGTNSSGQPYTNRYLYAADETGGIVIYNPDTNTPTYETKDVIPSGWTATKTKYRNLPEATTATDFTEATETQHLDPIEMTIDAANNSTNYGAYVIIKNVLIRPQSDNMLMEENGPSTHDASVMITDGGGNNIILYSNHTAPFNLPTDWEADTRYDIVGILGVYNSTQQIFPTGIMLNDETINSIETIDNGVKKVVYYNVQGIESSEPFDGLNIVVTEYENGTKKTNKQIYKF